MIIIIITSMKMVMFLVALVCQFIRISVALLPWRRYIYIPFVIVVVAGLVVIIIIIIFTIIIIVVNLPWLQAGHPAGFRAACSSDVTLMYRTSSDSAAFFLPVYFLIKINPCFYII